MDFNSNTALKNWRAGGKHLPPILRDFHDQKDFFKAMHYYVKVEDTDWIKDITWTKGHIYVIDCFLWFCARMGYTLQKSRAKLEFDDIKEAIKTLKDNERDAFAKMLEEAKK